MLSTTETTANLSIKQIIAEDIKKYAEEMNIPLRQLIKDFAKNTNVVLRTMERFFEENKKFTPHVTTIVDIYSQVYSTNSLAEILSKTPVAVSEYIKKNHMQFIGGSNNRFLDVSKHSGVQADLTSSSIFNQIYIMTSGDFGTDIAKVKEQFGASGLKQLDEMIKLGYVEIDENDQVKRKTRLTWDRAIRKNFIKTIISDVYNEENSDLENPNYISVAIGDVTPSDYELIREKMRTNYLEIMEIVNTSKPSYDEAIKFTLAKVLEKIEFKAEGDKLC
jgi:predicted transcriptional regulator